MSKIFGKKKSKPKTEIEPEGTYRSMLTTQQQVYAKRLFYRMLETYKIEGILISEELVSQTRELASRVIINSQGLHKF